MNKGKVLYVIEYGYKNGWYPLYGDEECVASYKKTLRHKLEVLRIEDPDLKFRISKFMRVEK